MNTIPITDQGGGTAIIWIHGFPLSSRIFHEQLDIMGARHLMPDLSGFGRAPEPSGKTTMDSYAREVLALLDERGIQRAVFAGFSMGGYVLLAAARLAPQRFAGAILIDTREAADTPEIKKGRYETMKKVKEQGVKVVVDAMLPKLLTPKAAPHLVEEVKTMMLSSSAAGVMAALKAMAERPDSSDLLPRLAVPALVVVGAGDTITPPSDSERMAKLLPRATLVTIPNAAHLSNLEQPAQFNEAIQEFLRRNQL